MTRMRAGVACVGAGAAIATIVLALGLGSSSALTTRPAERLQTVGSGLREARRLGPLGPDVQLHLELTLTTRNTAALTHLIASGRRVTPAAYARAFLPPARSVQRALRELRLAGLRATWTPGAVVVEATGSARAAERAFAISLNRYRSAEGENFFAPSTSPQLKPSLRGVVSSVAGLDDSGRLRTVAGSSGDPSTGGCGQPLTDVGGYTPSQVMSAYHFGPLSQGGLTGAGQTVVFVEINTFSASDLRCFAHDFGEPAFNVTVGPQRWGAPDQKTHDEADMDLEIVHSIAPAAHLVVYYAGGSGRVDQITGASAAAVKAYPTGILSVSLGGCEVQATDSSGNPIVAGGQTVIHDALQQFAATGGSAFIASGDQGAYICGPGAKSSTGQEYPTVSTPADDPYATAVGGTTLFVGGGGTYAGEAAWGAPFEGAGSGGGLSLLWQKPSWQTGPGVQNQYSNGYRQLPDVSALGDANTGWDVFYDGSWTLAAGTSAAAPLWAGLTALANQELAQLNLPSAGFVNPLLYGFAANARQQPARAFNDVARGENLYYSATPGWDYATGLGTPNATGIVDDFVHYRETHK